MTESVAPSVPVAALGDGVCIQDEDVAAELGFADAGLDASILPPMVRRRTSIATRAAITAAERACAAARTHRKLPAIFVSSAGEMQITDRLCRSIARQEYPLSPTQFHNSVHNTAAGYWSIATGSMASMQSMGALEDGFALGLLEAWCQLQTVTDRVLLVVFDEAMPERLLPDYTWKTCAFALVLDRDTRDGPLIHRPFQQTGPDSDPGSSTRDFPLRNPAMAALPLFQALRKTAAGHRQVALSSGARPWRVDVVVP
ncbi:MAG: beta-ketoacyl synthase chain length factor [Pseudomonadota bacterium]|nr:beta-ketoacyl synthase chain length factor [Pseudomonadota bacterium]